MLRDKPTIQGLHLTRAFGSGAALTVALRDISLELFRGQISLLMGPSGSGKSTLLAVLSGLLRPDKGQVLAFGQDLWRLSERERERFRLQECGFIFQGYNLFPALNAREQLEIVLRWGAGASARDARDKAESLLAQMDLTDKLHLRPSEMSGGEKQRVTVGRALIKQPTFCFADEPTSALDWFHGEQVVRLLQDAAHRRGAMVFVVSHDQRIIPYVDQVLRIEDGRLAEPRAVAKSEVGSLP